MNPDLLKKALEQTDLTIMHVAADTRISPRTIERYLTGKHRVQQSIELLLKQWVQKHLVDSKVSKRDLTDVA